MNYRPALTSDLDEIKNLLIHYNLPTIDCVEHIQNFVVAQNDDGLLAIGAFEHCGDAGLVRSIAVKETHKGHGIGEQIFQRIKSNALKSGITTLYLLTTDASGYFEQLGFSHCVRDEIPKLVKSTKQFTELCPATAHTMIFTLTG